jgi:hypothetical protein
MKKLVVLALLALAFVSTAFASDENKPYQMIKLGVDVDYTMVAMDAVNAQMNKNSSSVTNLLGSSVAAILEGDLILAPFLTAGARVGYIYCMPSTVNYNLLSLIIQKTTLNASLIPVEVGVSANLDLSGTPISVMVGIYGGYGIATASYENNVRVGDTYTQPYDGGGVIGEVLGKINLKLASGLSLNINGGYRLAKIAQMKLSKDVSYTALGVTIPVGTKGEVRKDSGTDVIFDYSGLNIGIGICLGF